MKVLIEKGTAFDWYHNKINEYIEVNDAPIDFFGQQVYTLSGSSKIIAVNNTSTIIQLRERKMKRITEK